MSKMKTEDLAGYVVLMLLNNRLFNHGLITEETKNKIAAEINSEYQRIK